MADSLSLSESDRYTARAILRSEFVYGEGMQAPGGAALLDLLASSLPEACERLLVLGCGLGGEAAALAKKYPTAQIKAVDRAPVMVEQCRRRYKDVSNIEFSEGDVRDPDLVESGTFDLIWTRDVLLYVEEGGKNAVFGHLHRWLRSGGVLRVVDFGLQAGADAAASPVAAYAKDKGYHLMSSDEYGGRLRAAGFAIAARADLTTCFAAFNLFELEMFQRRRDAFVRDYSQAEYDSIVARWRTKVDLATLAGGLAYHDFLCRARALRVYCAVTCDIFHMGHAQLFRNAKHKFKGCHLTVGVVGDESVMLYKARPLLNLDQRASVVEACRDVDEVIRDAPAFTSLDFMREKAFDVVFSGDDYTAEQVKRYYPGVPSDMYFQFSYTQGISSSAIKRARTQ